MGNYASIGDSYTKGESDDLYQEKGNYALAGNVYTKTESDGRYPTLATYNTAIKTSNDGLADRYTKGESDGRYPALATYNAAINDRYTKGEIDSAFNTVNNGLAARYTKGEIDNAFNIVNNGLADRYTKTQSDGRYPALAAYNAAIKTINDGLDNRYTKGQSDTIFATKTDVNTAANNANNTFATKTDLNTAANNANNTFETKTRVQSLIGTNTLNDLKPRTMWCADGAICEVPVDNNNASTIRNNKGRLHISGNELLYLLNKNGVIIGKEWGGNGNLQVQGNLFFKDPNHGMRYHTDPDGPFIHGWNGGSLGTVEGGERQALRWDRFQNVVLPGKNLYLGDWRIEDADELRFIHKGDMKMALRSNGQLWVKDNFYSSKWNKWL